MNDLEIHEGGLEHRTDNIEEIVQEAHKIAIDYMDRVGLKQAAIKNVPYNSPIYLFEQLKEYLRTSIHHQLQKAREDTIHGVLAVVSSKQNQFTSTYERGYQEAVRNILASIKHYHSELDQPLPGDESN